MQLKAKGINFKYKDDKYILKDIDFTIDSGEVVGLIAPSGFGKTTALCGRKKFGIEGLNPAETFLIQCANRELANLDYKLIDGVTSADSLKNVIGNGNRIQVGNISGLEKFKTVAKAIEMLAQSPFKNIVIDDFNYLSQDYYMANAMKGGWDRMCVPA